MKVKNDKCLELGGTKKQPIDAQDKLKSGDGIRMDISKSYWPRIVGYKKTHLLAELITRYTSRKLKGEGEGCDFFLLLLRRFSGSELLFHTIATLNSLVRRKEVTAKKQRAQIDSPSLLELSDPSFFYNLFSESSDSEKENMAAERTLWELATENVNQQPLFIQCPQLTVLYKLKSSLIHLLPSFNGLVGEDPHKHLKEFHVVCSTQKPRDVTEEQIKLLAFPFYLAGKAKDWLYYLPSGTITTWDEMKKQFFEKFFPASRVATLRKDICGIRQISGETLYEYWERFKQLVASCPQHQISEQLLIQYFYEGLLPSDRSIIDAASGGALVHKTPTQARTLISNMAANSQQFGMRQDCATKTVSQVNSSYNQRLDNLTFLVEKLVAGNLQQVKACGICSNVGHATDMCPTLQDGSTEQLNVVGGFPGAPQRKYDPYSNTYNPGWRDHPNLSYGNRQTTYQQQYQPQQTQFQPSSSQSTTSVNRLESQASSKLPSQTVTNPNQNVSAITLRSGKRLNEPSDRELKKELISEGLMSQKVPTETASKHVQDEIVIPPPFPARFAKSKKEQEARELLETFRKVEINIPLLDAIKQIPRYAKFLKELCTSKRKLQGNEKVQMGENVSAMFQRKLPPKCQDPGMFTIPCTIGNVKIEKAMLDLGASINVMCRSVYNSLNGGKLKETGVIIQLADRSNVYPDGVIEDLLVQVKGLVFPADFYVVDMGEDIPSYSASVLLGRPFLKTARTNISVYDGTLTMEFDGEVIKFCIYDSMKYPSVEHSVFSIDQVDCSAHKVFDPNVSEPLKLENDNNVTGSGNREFELSPQLREMSLEIPINAN
ncbi:uncharacterized protein [Rutidosis leptorrhynchoides]|uniref:uncharacterized protein n=1 Tax=Rutidosis leptorrhynchoides TaxID=125765 RepID=UPI003A99E326